MTRSRKRGIPRPVRNSRMLDFQHPTTRKGHLIHRADSGGYPVCGWYMRPIVYTNEPINCDRCREI